MLRADFRPLLARGIAESKPRIGDTFSCRDLDRVRFGEGSVSHPPEYPGRQRLKRASARAGNEAYQGAFEAVGAVLLGCGVGFWVDGRWDTSPWGVLVGAVVGFAAMVLRLVRLGQELHPDTLGSDEAAKNEKARLDPSVEDGLGIGVTPGMSDVLREDDAKPADMTDPTGESPRSNNLE
jgi:F0F1-type ATP synthase assembly protein I